MEILTSLFSQTAFPVAICIVLLWFINKQSEYSRKREEQLLNHIQRSDECLSDITNTLQNIDNRLVTLENTILKKGE